MESVAKDIVPGVVDVLDVDDVVKRIDIQAIMDRVDVNELLKRIDVNVLLEHIDVNALLAQVDVDALVERTQIGSIIARSGAGVAGKVIDVARSDGVGLDSFLQRWVDRLMRRKADPGPGGPPLLVGVSNSHER